MTNKLRTLLAKAMVGIYKEYVGDIKYDIKRDVFKVEGKVLPNDQSTQQELSKRIGMAVYESLERGTLH